MVKKRSAFTMIELVMVIVVLGIVASIGADIIASLYSNYLRVRTINRLETQTEITLEQIAKRLQYRVKDSTIARKTGSYLALSDSSVNDTYNILEWIGYSNESMIGYDGQMGWTGFIDLDSADTNSSAGTHGTLKTSESNLTKASNIISALTDSNIDLSTAAKAAALIFKGKVTNILPTSVNWYGNNTLRVIRQSDTVFNIIDTAPSEIYEQYYLAHSAYAIVPSATNSQDFNLTLYYNYQPWLGENYSDANMPNQVLAEHVNLFRFRQDQSVVHLKLCLHDANETGLDNYIVVCKEKVIY
jgi:prepilin-type N-terminal cleavage/methylation domain-containing protein